MKSKKKRNNKLVTKITTADYIKAARKASRDQELAQSGGWKRTNSVHKSKKLYNRKAENKDYLKDTE